MQAYTKTDRQLHLLSQIIAKANRTYVPARADDSHTNLYYDSLGKRITGRWINNGNEQLLLSLNLDNLKFEWLNASLQPLMAFAILDRTITDIEDEIAGNLANLNLKPAGFTDKLHFQIPDYPFAGQPLTNIASKGLERWQHYRQLANAVATTVLGYLQTAGEVRIWPHHFDTGIYVEAAGKVGIGFGLAMEDAIGGAPYFYVSGYPLQGELAYQALPDLGEGRWHIDANWRGAILSISKLTGSTMDNDMVIKAYLLPAITWFLR